MCDVFCHYAMHTHIILTYHLYGSDSLLIEFHYTAPGNEGVNGQRGPAGPQGPPGGQPCGSHHHHHHHHQFKKCACTGSV